MKSNMLLYAQLLSHDIEEPLCNWKQGLWVKFIFWLKCHGVTLIKIAYILAM